VQDLRLRLGAVKRLIPHEQRRKCIGFASARLCNFGTPWDANLLVKRKLRPLLRDLKIRECGLHAFRHANASLMDELSVPMKVRQQRLGHSDPRLTMNTYTHMASSDDERIAEQLAEILDAVGQNDENQSNKEKGPAFRQALIN
jgi:integrase